MWVGLVGLVLPSLSIAVHFFLARFTEQGFFDYQAFITIFSWRPIFESAVDIPKTSPLHRRLWGPIRHLESLHPYANPRGHHADPSPETSGFIFVRIQGGFHEIRNSMDLNFFDSSSSLAAYMVPYSDPVCDSQVQTTSMRCSRESNLCSYSFQYGDMSGTSVIMSPICYASIWLWSSL